ncbi:hypothetical protein K490DRAFT_35895 [Saccharata proteae CBS 121410]|uniref:Uncharacterized protein n=1 Tax=Saccharata proteae CBS 121410 TaxID=1314787 RepID=A0A9P4HZK1_9PEZI|nr:hypothetical protein K490DRAFT_35895 [Saccharata proteae CBS 121410]
MVVDPTPSEPEQASKPQKLPRLPDYARVEKRPLLHPAIASPYKNRDSQKVVYLKASTPFVSAVKRVRYLLKEIEKRKTQTVLAAKRKQRGDPIMAAAIAAVNHEDDPEEVVIKAAGKSIAKAMDLALYFQKQQDCKVRIRTGSAHAIDDIVEDPAKRRKIAAGKAKQDHEELPETRVRQTSVLEIAVMLH